MAILISIAFVVQTMSRRAWAVFRHASSRISFDTIPKFEIVYGIPLPFTGLPLSLAGFNNSMLLKSRSVIDPAVFAFDPDVGVAFNIF